MAEASIVGLSGKVAIISGSASGIGAAIVKELSLREAQVNRVLSTLSTESIAVEADISTVDGPQTLVHRAVQKFGQIDILVNNAGIAVNLPLEEQTLEHWDSLVNLNGRGVFLLTKAVLPHLSKKDSRIVNIDSLSSRAPPPMQTIYAGTKGIVDSFTRCWAKELPPKYGCTVNAVSPGPTMTEGFTAAGEPFMKMMQPVLDATPVGPRMATPAEQAFAVAFLCEPRASWINGLHLISSGGLHVE